MSKESNMLNIVIKKTEERSGYVELSGESHYISAGETLFLDENQLKELKKKYPKLQFKVISDTKDKLLEVQKRKDERKAEKLKEEVKKTAYRIRSVNKKDKDPEEG